MERREVLDLATYEARVGQGVGARIVAKFPADVRLAEAVRLSRAMVALGGLPSVDLVATAYGIGLAPAIVATLHENEWEAGAACTLERRVVLDTEYQADNFLGYTWRGSDARAGFGGDCTEEQVLELAEECRDCDYLCDEDEFESLASDYAEGTLLTSYKLFQGDDRPKLDEALCVCVSPEMALRTARVKSLELASTITVYAFGSALCVVSGSGLEAVAYNEDFQALIDSGK